MKTKLIAAMIAALFGLAAGNSQANSRQEVDTPLMRGQADVPQIRTALGAQPSLFQLAREGAEGPRGGDNERPGDRQRRGGKVIDAPADNPLLAREGAEGPRGGDNERPGDRQRRGGKVIDTPAGNPLLAREGAEGPRGGDNERPGDRQRRGGRVHDEAPVVNV